MVEKEEYFRRRKRSVRRMYMDANLERAAAVGGKDSREEALRFLEHEAGRRFNTRVVTAFVDAGPKMVDFVEQNVSSSSFLTGLS